MTKIFKENVKKYKVLTPNGFQEFAGIAQMGIKPLWRLEFEMGAYVDCTHDHKFYINLNDCVPASDLAVGDTVLTSHGDLQLLTKTDLGYSEPVYDLIEVAGGHRYYTNGILSSNCEFLVYDETLISSLVLAEMEGEKPLMMMGQTRWFKKPSAEYSYVIALDPAMGTGGNNAAIQVIELPTYIQVAEWQHNTTAIPGQIRILKDICQYIADTTKTGGSNVYWSVENNNIGEAALIVINDFGEENIPGLFISEPIRKGHVRKYRKGFNTTHSTKITACARLKTMVENNHLKIMSKPLISELKNFVATGSSFKAKPGTGDDLISAIILILRMINIMKDWDPNVYRTFNQIAVEEDYEPPMPIFVTSYF
jgi:hypothetical protein